MTDEPVFLTLDQIKELTGAGTRKTVIGNLLKNGIRHTIKANGWPCVTVAAITGMPAQAKAATREKWQPDMTPQKWRSNKAGT